MTDAKRIDDFRDQAKSYRRTARGLVAGVRDMYLGWAADLEARAAIIEGNMP